MPNRRSLEEIYRLLFGRRKCNLVRFGQAEDEPDFGAELEAGASDSIQGVDLEIQMQASRGLFPVLVIAWDVAIPRNMTAREVAQYISKRQSGGVQAKFGYNVLFCDRAVCGRSYQDLIVRLQSRTRAGLPAQMQAVMVERGLVVAEQWWPMRQGDRLEQVYFAKVPIPGRNPQG